MLFYDDSIFCSGGHFVDCKENIYASIVVSIVRNIPSECGPVVQEMLFTENVYG